MHLPVAVAGPAAGVTSLCDAGRGVAVTSVEGLAIGAAMPATCIMAAARSFRCKTPNRHAMLTATTNAARTPAEDRCDPALFRQRDWCPTERCISAGALLDHPYLFVIPWRSSALAG